MSEYARGRLLEGLLRLLDAQDRLRSSLSGYEAMKAQETALVISDCIEQLNAIIEKLDTIR